MWLSKLSQMIGLTKGLFAVLFAGLVLSGCQFQPLYGSGDVSGDATYGLSYVGVDEVNTRVGQQVRNHLIFLLSGGSSPIEPKYQAKLRVKSLNRTLANVQASEDRTAGSVEVTVSYDLLDAKSYKQVAAGTRRGIAAYDRTRQNFANARAQRDAENRAAREVAEALRLAIAADLKRQAAQ